MKAIQLILVGGMVLAGLLFWLRIRTHLFVKPLLIMFLGMGIFLVFFPDSTTVIANVLGVDRGADMVFYLYIVSSLIVIVHFYGRLRTQQVILTELVREQAIQNVIRLGEKEQQNPKVR
jgi:hypothetical protein